MSELGLGIEDSPLNQDTQVVLTPTDVEVGVHSRNTGLDVSPSLIGKDDDSLTDLSYSGPAPRVASKSFFTWPVAIWFIMSSEFCERYEFSSPFQPSISLLPRPNQRKF